MKVGVIMGGISSEKEVSLKSGETIIENLDKSKYEIVSIVLNNKKDALKKIKNIDFAFLALHGKFGEDGTIQAVLETLEIPYSGCGVLSSAICMNKDMTKKILTACDIRTADWMLISSFNKTDYSLVEKIGYPVVIKPNCGGSSVGTFIVNKKEDIKKYVKEALKYDKEVIIEKFIRGDEITCTIIDGELFPIIAIKPKSSFFDFNSKYEINGANEYVIDLEKSLYDEVSEIALKSYKTLNCEVYARVDMIIQDKVPFVLEINTLPGMTKTSLVPKSAMAKNINFTRLLDIIIEKSIELRKN